MTRIYYAADGGSKDPNPERVLGRGANVMLIGLHVVKSAAPEGRTWFGIKRRSQQRSRLRRMVRAIRMGKDLGEVGVVNSHFLDSGSFTLFSAALKYAKANRCSKWDFYDTKEHWDYLNAYAEFVKNPKHAVAIDHYANIDAIPNPEITWRNQQALEKLGCTPVPVVHYPCDLKWLKHYLDRGYGFIALGGLVVRTNKSYRREWLDKAFAIICDTKDRMPKVKVHGFGIGMDLDLLLPYPWWSVDSASWEKVGSFGSILMPPKRDGKYVFDEEPLQMTMSADSPDAKRGEKHYLAFSRLEKQLVSEWLEFVNVPLGKLGPGGEELERGVLTHHSSRKHCNLYYFEMLRKSIPAWPWPLARAGRTAVGIREFL